MLQIYLETSTRNNTNTKNVAQATHLDLETAMTHLLVDRIHGCKSTSEKKIKHPTKKHLKTLI